MSVSQWKTDISFEGKFDDAIMDMKKALSLDPSFEPAQTGLQCAQQDRENKLKRGWWRCTTYCYLGLCIKVLHILRITVYLEYPVNV